LTDGDGKKDKILEAEAKKSVFIDGIKQYTFDYE
jgi:hypothetical protein